MGGRLVCEFAYIRQGETESDEVNRFPFGQTHVGFAKLYPCISSIYSNKKSSSPGDCIRATSIKILDFAKLYTCISSIYSDKKSSSPEAEKSSSPDILYILRCLAATEKSSSPGNCIRVASIKIRGRQYYSLTALISVLTSRNSAGV